MCAMRYKDGSHNRWSISSACNSRKRAERLVEEEILENKRVDDAIDCVMVMAEICGEIDNENYKLKESIKELLSMVTGSCNEGELFLSVMLLLLGMAGVVWGDVIICVFGFMLAWLACFLECRRLMKRMNEVRDKLDLVLQGKRVFWVPEVSAAQVWSELHEKHERERRERFRERFMGWLFVLVVLVVFYCYFFT